MTAAPQTVEPWEVEHGDVIFGLASPIDWIQSDGEFWYYGANGTIVAKRHCGWRVQVVRGVGEAGIGNDREAASRLVTSPTPPHGIRRVRGGMYVVTP